MFSLVLSKLYYFQLSVLMILEALIAMFLPSPSQLLLSLKLFGGSTEKNLLYNFYVTAAKYKTLRSRLRYKEMSAVLCTELLPGLLLS